MSNLKMAVMVMLSGIRQPKQNNSWVHGMFWCYTRVNSDIFLELSEPSATSEGIKVIFWGSSQSSERTADVTG